MAGGQYCNIVIMGSSYKISRGLSVMATEVSSLGIHSLGWESYWSSIQGKCHENLKFPCSTGV